MQAADIRARTGVETEVRIQPPSLNVVRDSAKRTALSCFSDGRKLNTDYLCIAVARRCATVVNIGCHSADGCADWSG
jgi:hypothetical protein